MSSELLRGSMLRRVPARRKLRRRRGLARVVLLVAGVIGLLATASLATAAVPKVTVDATPEVVSSEDTTVAFSADQPGPFAVVLNGQVDLTCATTSVAGGSGSYVPPAAIEVVIPAVELAEGGNTIRVCITNDGDLGSATVVVTKDSRPGTVLTRKPAHYHSSTSATFAFSSPTPSVTGFECSLEGGPPEGPEFAPCNGGSVTYAGLDEGEYNFIVRAVTSLGKKGKPAVWHWWVDTIAPETSFVTGPSGTIASRSATIDFASEAGAHFQCKLNGGPYADCVPSHSYTGLADGNYSVHVRAVDKAGNRDATPLVVSFTVVGLAATPAVFAANVRKARLKTGDHRVTVTWARPRDPDFRRVEIVRVPGKKSAARSLVYRGNKRSFVDRGLKNGVEYMWIFYATDKAGNRSGGIKRSATPPVRAKLGNRVTLAPQSPVVFWWKPVKKARFYNVQLFRGQTKVLSSWPSKPSISLSGSWNWEGSKRKLSVGKYKWFVWPGFGKRANSDFGKLVGSGKLVVKKPVPPKKKKKT